MKRMTSFLQVNIGERNAAHDLMIPTAAQLGTEVVIISEPNRALSAKLDGWYMDAGGRAAIGLMANTPYNELGPTEQGFRWVELPGFRIYNCYCSPNSGSAVFEDFLSRLEISIMGATIPVVVAGDFNAKSRTWCSRVDDTKGDMLADLM